MFGLNGRFFVFDEVRHHSVRSVPGTFDAGTLWCALVLDCHAW